MSGSVNILHIPETIHYTIYYTVTMKVTGLSQFIYFILVTKIAIETYKIVYKITIETFVGFSVQL